MMQILSREMAFSNSAACFRKTDVVPLCCMFENINVPFLVCTWLHTVNFDGVTVERWSMQSLNYHSGNIVHVIQNIGVH